MTKNFWTQFIGYIKGAWRELLTILIIAAIDLISKNIVQGTMQLGEVVTLIPGLLFFAYIHNTKAAYGSAFGLEKLFGEDGVITFFIVLTIIALVAFGFLMYKFKRRSLLSRIAVALIIGGAFGNLVDRIMLRAVRDFIRIEAFGFAPFGCFNIADMALVFGVVLFAVYFIFLFDRDEKRFESEKNNDGERLSVVEDACDESKVEEAPTMETTAENVENGSNGNDIDS